MWDIIGSRKIEQLARIHTELATKENVCLVGLSKALIESEYEFEDSESQPNGLKKMEDGLFKAMMTEQTKPIDLKLAIFMEIEGG